MIYGIGTDICDIRRVEATLARRGQRFAEKVLGPDELRIFLARRARSETRGIRFLATRFSAKEAFSKAIGLGLHLPMRLPDCQIVNEPSGKPVLKLSGTLAEWFSERGLSGQVTLSDESDYAVSFVVVETGAGPAPQR
ncbi:MAG: holo-ACP synthase [Rubrivivax sp.]|nr:MAG: holo-ACP synthase [Rubrivivax sp.]